MSQATVDGDDVHHDALGVGGLQQGRRDNRSQGPAPPRTRGRGRVVGDVPAAPTTASTRDAHGELLAWAASLSSSQESSAQLLARVDMLVEDLRDDELRDDELRALLHQGSTKHTTYLSDLIQRCQDHGHLSSRIPAEDFAHLLLDAAHGALLCTAVHPDPTVADPGRTLTALLEALA